MKRRKPARPRRRRALGQALTEYILVVAVLVGFIFTPVPPPLLPARYRTGENSSVFTLTIDAFDIYIDSYHTVIILPIP